MAPEQARMLSPSAVVKAIRDGLAWDLPSLAEVLKDRIPAGGRCALGTGNSKAGMMKRPLTTIIEELVDADILSYDADGRLTVTEGWTKTQLAMRISLTSVDQMNQQNPLVVQPYFGPHDEERKMPDVFVLMSFEPALKPIYQDHISKVVKDCKLTVGRADDFFTAHSIMRDVWTAILRSRAVIADCTGRNANVFYEIGVAHTIGKPVILITQNEQDVPFDLRSIRFITYAYTPPGMKVFRTTLKATLADVFGMGT